MPHIQSISVSKTKGVQKTPVEKAMLINDFGIKGDAHAGFVHRQVSLLALESIQKMQKLGLDVKSGDFAENITTEGIDLCKLQVGDIVTISGVDLVISQMGKICHKRCAIYYSAGDCVMPKEGIFAVVRGDGEICVSDGLIVTKKKMPTAAVVYTEDFSEDELLKLEKRIIENINAPFVRKEFVRDEVGYQTIMDELANRQKIDNIYVLSMNYAVDKKGDANIIYLDHAEADLNPLGQL